MRKIIAFSVATFAVFMLALAPTVNAVEFVAPDKDKGDVTISSSETHRNLYTAGGSVFMNAPVMGDLYTAGGNLTIEGNVEQDLVVVGGTVNINGTIGGDVRVLGGTVIVNNKISGDLLVFGGTVQITEKASVGGDLFAGVGTISVDGAVTGKTEIMGEDVTLNSAINGSVSVKESKSLTIGPKAVIPQKITYSGQTEAVVKDGATIAGVEFSQAQINKTPAKNARHAFATMFTVMFLVKLIGITILGLILMKLFPQTSVTSVMKIKDNPWANLGWGAMFLFVGPILVLITAFTIIGLYVAIAVFIAWLLVLTFAGLTGSTFVGAWVISKLFQKQEVKYNWQALLAGLIVVSLASIIPVLGMLAFLILLLVSCGAMLRQIGTFSKNQSI